MRGDGVMLLSQNDIFQEWATYGNVITGNKRVHQSSSTIYEFIHLGRSEKKKCQRGTSSTSDEKSNHDPAGWFRTGEGFQDKAAIKNEWLFATNTVAPESFMGHVMEKYVGTSDRGNPLPWQTSLEQQGLDVIESQQALKPTCFPSLKCDVCVCLHVLVPSSD